MIASRPSRIENEKTVYANLTDIMTGLSAIPEFRYYFDHARICSLVLDYIKTKKYDTGFLVTLVETLQDFYEKVKDELPANGEDRKLNGRIQVAFDDLLNLVESNPEVLDNHVQEMLFNIYGYEPTYTQHAKERASTIAENTKKIRLYQNSPFKNDPCNIIIDLIQSANSVYELVEICDTAFYMKKYFIYAKSCRSMITDTVEKHDYWHEICKALNKATEKPAKNNPVHARWLWETIENALHEPLEGNPYGNNKKPAQKQM